MTNPYLPNLTPTTLPPLVIIKAGGQQLPIWPSLPSVCGAELPTFCPAAYWVTIKKKFVIHFHQYPEIPIDTEGTHLTASKIHVGAVYDMYSFC
jgi:hypothetical protein